MKIVLYSGGQSRSNHKLHRAVVELAQQGKKSTHPLQLTYIPFCSDNASIFYHRTIRRFRSHGVERFFCLHVDASPGVHEIEEALRSDIIYLAGGNTFYFLKHLREAGMLDRLEKFTKKGGVLAGLSAGALIMSPTIKLAADHGLGPDPNEVGLKNLKGIGLFPFEFSPHFHETPSEIKAHQAYSKKTRNPVYAVKDGSGVVITKNKISIVGEASIFYRGKKQ